MSPLTNRPWLWTPTSSASRTGAGLAPGKTPEAVEDALMKSVPAEFALNAHHWLILHGRYICKARKPDCASCHIRDLCAFKEKTG
jgi:endonuclease-3